MKPFEHQVVTTEFLITNKKCHIWNEAGTGKTACVVWAINYIKKTINSSSKILVICTKSTMENVWWREFFKLSSDLSVDVLAGDKKTRLKLLKKDSDVFVINHDGVKVISADLAKKKFDVVVVDESTALKNAQSERWKKTNAICKNAEYIWLLTGTPAPQSPMDLFGQGRLVDPDNIGRSYIRFRDLLMNHISMYKWLPKSNWESIAKEKIGKVLRYTRSECLDLPCVTYSNYYVGMSSIQKTAFDDIKKRSISELQLAETGGVKILAVHEGVVRLKLLQICCGFVYSQLNEDLNLDDDADIVTKVIGDLTPEERLESTLDIICECDKGVLLFAPFRSALQKISEFLTSKKITNEVISGSVSGKKRNEIFDKFQSGEIKVIIAHPRTMGHGITLTAADTVIWYCVTSDNEIYEQANARINRIGQTSKMRVIHLLSTKFEESVLSKLQHKQKTQQTLLDILKNED